MQKKVIFIEMIFFFFFSFLKCKLDLQSINVLNVFSDAFLAQKYF